MRFVQHTLRQLLALLAVIAVLTLGMAWIGSRWLADKALVPVETLSSTAERISETSLKTRVSLDAPYAEFQRLAHVFNAMLERLQNVFESQRRFIANAAHELKTPLTVIMGSLEVTLRKPRSAEEYREVLIGNLGQVERLIALTRSLLTMVQFMGVRPPLRRLPLELEPLVKDLIGELAVLADNRQVTLALDAHPTPPVQGDEGWLRHILINLLDNAVRYTPPGGTVTVCIEEVGNKVVIEWGWARVALVTCLTCIPRTTSASAMSDRWQRQGTASAHMMATCVRAADLISLSSPVSNSGVCM